MTDKPIDPATEQATPGPITATEILEDLELNDEAQGAAIAGGGVKTGDHGG